MLAKGRRTVRNLILRARSVDSEEGRPSTERERELEQRLKDSQLLVEQLRRQLNSSKHTGFYLQQVARVMVSSGRIAAAAHPRFPSP